MYVCIGVLVINMYYYNPYVSSTLSIRYKGPVCSYSFNECTFYKTNNYLSSTPSQSCCCVCCYTSTKHRLVCGLRQSSLIHCSSSRSVFTCSRDPCRKCSCGYVKERSFCGENGRERKFRRMVSEGRSCDFENAEMMLSLLIEDVGEESYSVLERDSISFETKGRFLRKKDKSAASLRSKYEALKIESRENEARSRRMVSEGRSCDFENAEMMLGLLIEEVGEEHYGVLERDFGSLEVKGSDRDWLLRKKSKCAGSNGSLRSKYEAFRVESRESEAKSRRKVGRTGEDEEVHRAERRKGRKSGSSCSSYYTCSSLGQDCESDSESLMGNKTYAEESGEVLRRDPKGSGKAVYKGEIKENLSGVGSYKVVESDWRKKSEKKLNEVEIRDGGEAGHNRGSNSYKQFDTADKKSTFVSESEARQKYSRRNDKAIGGYESTRKQKQFMQTSEDDVEAVSSSTKLFSGRDEMTNVAGSYVFGGENEHLKTDDRVSQRDDYGLSTETSNQALQIEDINVKKISNFHYEDKVKRQEDRYLHDTEKGYYLKNEEDPRKMDLRRKSRHSSEISDDRVSRRDDHRSRTEQSNKVSQIQDFNVRTNISRGQYEDKVKIREDQSSVISSSVLDTGNENQYYSKGEESLRLMDSRGKFRQAVEISDDRASRRGDYGLSAEHSDKISQVHDTNVKKTNISHARYEDKVKRQEDQSSVLSSSVQDSENRYYLQREEDLRLVNSEKKSQQSMKKPAEAQYVQSGRQVSEKVSKKGSLDISTMTLGESSDTQVTSTRETSDNRIASDETYSSMVVKSTEESKRRRETSDNQLLRFESTKETGVISHKPSSLQASLILEITPNVGSSSNSQEIVITPKSRYPSNKLTVGQIQTFEDPSTSFYPEDALGSAHRFQKSSTKVVDEFLEMVTHEASSSHHEMEKSTSKEKMLVKDHKHEEKSSSEYADFDFKSKDQESRTSSGSSGVKGPSDEIWDEVAPSTREPVDAQTQIPEGIVPSQNIVVKRTGRSLWNVFSDIVRLPWSSRSRTSTPKSVVKNSPDQSTKSETWFSSHDRDETSDENMKRRNKSMSRESIPTPTQYQGEGGYISSDSKEKISPGKTQIGSTTPKGSSSVSSEENFKVSGSTMMETSVSMPTLRRKYPEVDDMADVDKRPFISASGSLTGKEQVAVSSSINLKGTVGGDMKRRMFQRTNQVIKDRFDEWEEAFTLETEQRKIDEEFMREALLEAKKAGDMWEVPVGAVLVQHGKIIARGYNLVEELRDSTAHAEMICIREGSNQLRTWRLADTTLYVTLEPCPMCAGAILQARVDTVVWGAPNKLLGADGSWIRLFSGGGEGGTSSESTDKPPAPIHPFHPKIVIRRGVLGTECADVMQQFFQLRRRKKGNKQLPDIPPTPPSSLPISNHPTKILHRMQDAFHFMFCL